MNLRKKVTLFLYLNIYTLFFSIAFSQELTLELITQESTTSAFKDSVLPQKKFKDYKNLKKNHDTLFYKLQSKGYIEARALMLEKINDTAYQSHYQLGKKYNIIKVEVNENYYNLPFLKKRGVSPKQPFFICSIDEIEILLEKFAIAQADLGDPFSKIFLSELSLDTNDTITGRLNIINYNKRSIDKVIVKGYEKFPVSFLKYYAGIKKGRPFLQSKVLNQTNTLDNLGFVTVVKPPEALFKKDSTIVYCYLEKTNFNLFDGVLGFATNEETQNIEFNGYLNLQLNNNLNFGEQLVINYKADGGEQQNFSALLQLPYLFKSPFGVSFNLNLFRRDSTFVTTDQEARLLYQYSPRLNSQIGYKSYESNNLLDDASQIQDITDYNAQFFLAGLAYTIFQNNKLFPTKFNLMIDTEIGKRETTSNTINQFKIKSVASYIINLNERNSIFLNNDTRVFSSENYFTNELYRLGGFYSIRGFNENSIDASLFSVLNTEYRFLLNETSFVHSVIDIGYFENKITDTRSNLYSFGLGLGLNTKAGLLRFIVANGISENQQFRANNTKIHLSLFTKF